MAFTPFARFRTFSLENLKSLLEVYPDMIQNMSWNEASNIIEAKSKGYKKTAYQQACQFGLEDRGEDVFRIQNYLFSFDDDNLVKYTTFWFKVYFAPNPYVNSDDTPMILYSEISKAVLASYNYEINFYNFFEEKIGGKSEDILINAIRTYGEPLKYRKDGEAVIIYIDKNDVSRLQQEVDYIEHNFPIGNYKSKKEFFERFTYKKFCKFYGIENDINALKDMSKGEKVEKSNKINFYTGYESEFSHNRIVFGAPGTGKSFTLNKEKDKLLGQDSFHYERVTFHPSYSYANFVGTYKPTSNKDENGQDVIQYEYVPGPFMRVYVKALENSKDKRNIKPFLLLIEEMNRANVASVFGEIFQLLDRNEKNMSEYAIHATEDMKKYLAKELDCKLEDVEEMRIPDNMFIWATMNSADQGVFPMDTAFKRRWEFEYIGVDTEEEKVMHYVIPIGSAKNRKYVKWNELRKRINDILSSDECRVNEDKLLGPFFMSKNMLENAITNEERFVKAFENKVIMYLFEDAMKMRPANIFKGHKGKMIFSEICKTFEEKGEELFGINDIANIDLNEVKK